MRQGIRTRALKYGLVGGAILAVLLSSRPVAAVQTFPDPFGGEGIHTDLRAGSTGRDIGDVFLLREGPILRIRIFLEAPNTFKESQVCVSGAAFDSRLAPGSCQYQKQAAASDAYDITLPPSSFPTGTVPFSDPLGPMCAQIHVAYDAPGLARTARGGGTAYAGWLPGQPFFGSICLAAVPDPPDPGDPTVTVTKTGAVVAGDLQYTVTVENPTNVLAPDVTLVDTLPDALSWTLPPSCGPLNGNVVSCDLGDIPGGGSVQLVFTGTLNVDDCGAFVNQAEAFIGSATEAASTDVAAVEVTCPPEPDEPTILITKVATSAVVTVPGTVSYLVTVENVGPGDATNVEFTDELAPGPNWTIGSGSNVCSITGNTLSCAVPVVPDGVFEVLEIFGDVDGSFCGFIDNTAAIAWEGGSQPEGATADAGTVEITGCNAVAPATVQPSPTADVGAGGSGDGDVPNTAMAPPAGSPWLPELIAAIVLATILASVATQRIRPRR